MLNVPGTFDDKVRQMLAEKTSKDSKNPQHESKPMDSATKKVPGVKKAITKPTSTPTQVIRDPGPHQSSQFRQGPANEPARMANFHKSGPGQNFYPQSTNPGPQIYPSTFSQNQGPLHYQRHGPVPNISGSQSMAYPQPYGDHYGVQNSAQFPNGIGPGPSSNKHQIHDYMIKAEDQPYPMMERGMMHDSHDPFLNEPNAGNAEVGLSRNSSSHKPQPLSLKIAGSNPGEPERDRSPFNSFPKGPFGRDPVRNFGPGGGYSPERSGFFEKIEYNETPSEISESMSRDSGMKIKKKVIKPLQKPTKHLQKYEESVYTGKGASLSIMEKKEEEIINLAYKMEDDLEEGELPNVRKPLTISPRNPTASMNSYLNTLYSKPNAYESDLAQDDTVLFLYDSKSFFVDAASFSFPIDLK